MDVLSLLKRDHAQVKALFKEFEGLGPNARASRTKLAKKIMNELTVHDNAEEQTVYGLLRQRVHDAEDRIKVLEAFEEHALATHLIHELQGMDTTDEQFVAKFGVLRESVEHHIKDEEGYVHKIAKAVLEKEELNALGPRFESAKQQQAAV